MFRKHRTPADVGRLLYEALRLGMQSGGDLSVDRFVQSLDKSTDELDGQYIGEIMIGLMFGAVLAIERSATHRTAEQLTAALKAEFLNHLQEQGARAVEKAEWESVLANRFLTYRMCLEDYSGFEPPWKLGRAFFWNIIQGKEYVAMSIKICTLYLLAARDVCQTLLNEYGPTLLVSLSE